MKIHRVLHIPGLNYASDARGGSDQVCLGGICRSKSYSLKTAHKVTKHKTTDGQQTTQAATNIQNCIDVSGEKSRQAEGKLEHVVLLIFSQKMGI